jgi:hypothetical protein
LLKGGGSANKKGGEQQQAGRVHKILLCNVNRIARQSYGAQHDVSSKFKADARDHF